MLAILALRAFDRLEKLLVFKQEASRNERFMKMAKDHQDGKIVEPNQAEAHNREFMV